MCIIYYCSGFFKAGDYEAAINAFSQAISLNPMLPVYPVLIVYMYYNKSPHCTEIEFFVIANYSVIYSSLTDGHATQTVLQQSCLLSQTQRQ